VVVEGLLVGRRGRLGLWTAEWDGLARSWGRGGDLWSRDMRARHG